MKKHLLLGALVALTLTVPSFAEEGKAGMSEADMARMQKLTTPAEQHAWLGTLEGEFKYTSTFWMTPEGQPEVSQGTSSNKMIFGGRFLEQKMKGMMMGQPFEGVSIVGYDLVGEKTQSIWYDSMMTGIMVSKGTIDGATKKLTEEGSGSCPMTGEKDMWMKGELNFADANRPVYTMWAKGKDGKEFKSGEIVYERTDGQPATNA